MKNSYSTREAAQKLGVSVLTLQRHVSAKTIDAPQLQKVGGVKVRLWSDRDIQKARKVLSQTKPGRKKKPSSRLKSYEEWLATAGASTLASARAAFGDDLRAFYEKFRTETETLKPKKK